MILLDSHPFIWLVNGDAQLGQEAREVIRQAYHANTLYLSPISIWEIGLKASRGKLSFDRPLRSWIQHALRATRTQMAPLTVDVALDCADLPPEFHGDPADRIIASTARTSGFLLLTDDTKLLFLARKGYLQAQRV